MKENDQALLVHVGIPRTSSSTVRRVLREVFTKPLELAEPTSSSYKVLPENRVLLLQESIFPVHKKTKRLCRYFTLLRDPVRAVVSEYYWRLTQRHFGTQGLWTNVSEEAMKFSMSLEEYVAELPRCLNFSARLIVSSADEAATTHGLPYYPGNNAFFDDCDEDKLLERVLEIIDKQYAFVGVMELFEEAMFVLANLADIDNLPLWQRTNASVRPPGWTDAVLPQTLRNRIEESTAVDRKLHGIMAQRFIESPEYKAINPEALQQYKSKCRNLDMENLQKFYRDGLNTWNDDAASLKKAFTD